MQVFGLITTVSVVLMGIQSLYSEHLDAVIRRIVS